MNTRTKILIAILLVGIGIASRFLPHLWNFTALTGIALFAGNYLGARYVLPIVFGAMFLSDIFIGFYDPKMMFVVYASFALVGLTPLLFKGNKVYKIACLSLFGSTFFFLTTNWAVWFFGTMYAPDLSGLIASYVAGIPFYKNALVGDLWYTFSLFATYELATYLIKSKKTKLAEQMAEIRILR